MSEVFTEKQKQTIKMLKEDKFKRINLLEGSVRSGKTYISLIVWAFWIASQDKSQNFLMCAKSLSTLKRNCLDLLQGLVGEKNFTYSLSKKEAVLFSHKIYLEGVNDARAENKIRGMTLAGAYCDELTLFTEDFFNMLLSRLSAPGAKLFATTNPDNPSHWVYKKFLKRHLDEVKNDKIDESEKLSMTSLKYLIDDNTFLNEDYIASVKNEYTGVFYERFIKGRWVAAEGVIYPDFADNPERFTVKKYNPDKIQFATIGVDFGGNKSAHAFVLTGFTKGFKEVVTLKEYYHKGKISPKELEDNFIYFVKEAQKKYKVYDAYCDSAESTLIEGLKNAVSATGVPIDIRLAKKGKIVDRIRFYNALMSKGRYFVNEECQNVISALSEAVWDSKSLEDKRLDDGNMNVDSLDALEYSTEDYMKDILEAINFDNSIS